MNEGELLIQEGGGAHADELMLEAYDRKTGAWALEKEGEFWDAVALAHSLGRRGKGVRIAVVDDGFDRTIPALQRQRLFGATSENEPSAHGTVAALLILEVAPEADLLLFSTAAGGRLQEHRVVAAIDACTENGVHVVNLSLGVGLQAAKLLSVGDEATDGPNQNSLEPDDWRSSFRMPASPLSDAVKRALDAGVTCVSSAGNHADYIFVPAMVPGVVSVGFETVVRTIELRMEETSAAPPSYSQSVGADLLLVQPPNVVGSSFACPLLSGFCALMQDRSELPAHLRCARRAANAAGLLKLLQDGEHPTSEMIQLVDRLMKAALTASPHRHYEDADVEPCFECAFLAAPAYIDFGLFALSTGNPQVTVQLMLAFRRSAPTNPYAAANLGVAWAALAQRALSGGDEPTARAYLAEASANMAEAVALRPGYEPYMKRLIEFKQAVSSPSSWTMLP